jgi:hypothetical protein
LVVVPVVNVVLDRSGTCTAAKYEPDCSVTFQKSILGEVIRDSLFNDLTALKTKVWLNIFFFSFLLFSKLCPACGHADTKVLGKQCSLSIGL